MDPSRTRSSRLTRLLLAKLLFDFLFLTAAVVAYAFSSLPPAYRGWVDVANANEVSGWVCYQARPGVAVEVQLFIDGRFAGQTKAELPRPDVNKVFPSLGEGCGFRFKMSPLARGEHWVRVFAVDVASRDARPSVQQIGETTNIGSE